MEPIEPITGPGCSSRKMVPRRDLFSQIAEGLERLVACGHSEGRERLSIQPWNTGPTAVAIVVVKLLAVSFQPIASDLLV